jgi:uncharacterized membrane protein
LSGFYTMFEARGADWAEPWLAVGFAAFYLALLRLPALGKLRTAGTVLSGLHLTAAVVFLTIAIPLKAHGRWLTIGWLVEGAALLWGASRMRSMLLRVLAIGCLALGLVALLVEDSTASVTPFFNERFGAYCVGIAAFGFASWVANNAHTEADAEHQRGWRMLALTTALVVSGLVLLAVGLEIHNYWWVVRWHGDWNHAYHHRMIAQFTYSAWFMIYGAILLGTGFWRRSAFLRWQALVLLAVAIAKVFLVDVSELTEGYRILSFLGLGALLLAVSYVYQRDWLSLRDASGRNEGEQKP